MLYMNRENYPWVIIGGGVQGAIFASFLVNRLGKERVCIIDPNQELLEQWYIRSENSGMDYMRSSSVHHIDELPTSLLRYSQENNYNEASFTQPYLRPSLELFDNHSRYCLEKNGINKLHIRGEVTLLNFDDENQEWIINYSTAENHDKEIIAKNILLAIGSSSPFFPSWSSHSLNVEHLLANDFSLENILNSSKTKSVAVVGGGMTAIQAALKLVKNEKRVYLVHRKALRCHQFDALPAWMNKNLEGFREITEAKQRKDIITRERNTGSLTPELFQEVTRLVHGAKLFERQGEIIRIREENGSLIVELNGEAISVDSLLLGTGLDWTLPQWLLETAMNNQLPLTDWNYPLVMNGLEWGKGLYVSGRLAELFLGPIAGNIVGARIALPWLEQHLSF